MNAGRVRGTRIELRKKSCERSMHVPHNDPRHCIARFFRQLSRHEHRPGAGAVKVGEVPAVCKKRQVRGSGTIEGGYARQFRVGAPLKCAVDQ